MKIGCDLRFLTDATAYGKFIKDVLVAIINQRKDHTFFLYAHASIEKRAGNVVQRRVPEKKSGLWNDLLFSRELKKDDLDVFLCFDENKPYFYTGKTILFIQSLAHVFYADEKFSISHTIEKHTYPKILKSAAKIVCFDDSTKDDLNERFNISEDTISVIKPYFVFQDLVHQPEVLSIDVKAKHNLALDYFIYNAGYGIDKNVERLVEVFARLREMEKHYALFVLGGDEVGTDLEVRKAVLDNDLADRIFFHSNIKKEEEGFLFSQSLGVIYPVLYESFPFTLNKAVFYNTPIIASHISSVKSIFDGNIEYFNPVSKVDMTKSIADFARKNHAHDYSNILSGMSQKSFLEEVQTLIFGK